jgi:hypothetical protein
MKIKEFFAVYLGMILCSFILWNRLIRLRVPYELSTMEFTYFRYFFLVVTIIMLIISIFTSLINIFKWQLFLTTKDTWFFKILSFIKEAPNELFTFIYNRISFRFVETPMSYIVVYFYNRKGIIFFSLLLLLPTLILSIIFFIEVIFYNSVFIFIKTLPLLILPLVLSLCLHISKIHGNTYLDYIRKHVEFFKYENEEQIYIRLKDEFKDVTPKISLEACEAYYYIYNNLANFAEAIKEKKAELRPYISLLYSNLYLISWLYILHYSFYH